MRQHIATFLLREKMSKNKKAVSLIGKGFNNVITPAPIRRYVLENPQWYTAYSPYQAEISQGRLECLYNYQRMIQELTALPLANASMLDIGSTAAEVCSMTNAYHKNNRKTFFVSEKIHPYIIDILETKCDVLDLKLKVDCPTRFQIDDDTMGMLFQYPDTYGDILIPEKTIADAKANKSVVSCLTDILAITKWKPPGEIGADIAFGTSQRFSVPLYYGGPHAAFLASKADFLRQMPGRIVGKTKDSNGKDCFRLALQSREQHIRKEKATSNICTSQALLANISALSCVYYGEEGIKDIARTTFLTANQWKDILIQCGFVIYNENFFDTITIWDKNAKSIYEKFLEFDFLPFYDKNEPFRLTFSFDETISYENMQLMQKIITPFRNPTYPRLKNSKLTIESINMGFKKYKRETPLFESSIFKKGMNETDFKRYVYDLAQKDYTLCDGMIPLGSCTMKLNAAFHLEPLSWPEVANVHPFAPLEYSLGYYSLINCVKEDLQIITGFNHSSFQSNSGAMGEYTALLCIRKYHKEMNEQRNVCIIPSSAHGTNFASASLAGMTVVKFDDSLFDSLQDFQEFCKKYRHSLAAMMITYPNTNGVFQENIEKINAIVHKYGGLVYFDGANMNALAGNQTPSELGADVCHLNLHKTFCIPHGGGGPGLGPIFCNSKLAKYLPNHRYWNFDKSESSIGTITASQCSSASLLTIPYLYFREMSFDGIRNMTNRAIKNANYMKNELSPYFKVATGSSEIAHEFILDMNEFRSKGITEVDIAKRLIDYSFHPPTMSWPVKGAIMIEPTESESKKEMDRFIRAMINIRQEIDTCPDLLKNAPHPISLIKDGWEFPYSMKEAFFPLPELENRKFWPSVGRVDDVFGDQLMYSLTRPIPSES